MVRAYCMLDNENRARARAHTHTHTRIHTHTHTHLEYVILVAFPLQQWLHKRAPHCYVILHCLSRCDCYESSLPSSREQFLLLVGVTFSNLGLEETHPVSCLSGVLA